MARKSGFNFRKFDKFTRQIQRGSAAPPPYGAVFKRWGTRYLAWTKRLFIQNSRGGGDWPNLAPSTIAGRRAGPRRHRRKRGSGYRKRKPTGVAILRDSGILLRALTIGAPGNLFRYIRNGVRVGFGGSAKHPDGKATIKDIAVFHDQGKGRLPKRQILFRPDRPLVRVMMADLRKAINQLGRTL